MNRHGKYKEGPNAFLELKNKIKILKLNEVAQKQNGENRGKN